MKKQLFIFCLLSAVYVNCLAQTIVKMMMPEQPKEALSVVTLFSEALPVGTPIVLGAIGYDIKGGTDPYVLTWMKDNSVITTGNIAVITPVTGSSYKLKITDKNNCTTEVAINVSASSKVRKESSMDDKIFVTPTLVTNQIIISFLDLEDRIAQVKLFDSKGVLRLNKAIDGNSIIPLDLSAGVYFVVVQKGELFHVQKIIVQ